MNSLLSAIEDSVALQIIFAAWTGFYLWQIIVGDEGSQLRNFGWLAAGFIAGMIYLGGTVKQGT